ncbi:MAG: hypothetical protein IPF56_04890 [Chloroflexi bacterium]|nr:hypothetical protein [Chloroflexota bacterium]
MGESFDSFSIDQFTNQPRSETYYEDGFPNAQNMVNENPLGEYRAYYNGARPVRILQNGFLQYLNEQQVEDLENIEQIDDVLNFSVQEIELGGKESKTWIVAVDFLKYHTRSFMLVERVENGPYKQISNILPSFSSRYYEDGESEAIVDYDLTGDGINEIIIHNETYLGGNATDQMLHIYTWTGDRLEKLESLDLHYYDSYYFAPKYEFGDFIKMKLSISRFCKTMHPISDVPGKKKILTVGMVYNRNMN